MFCNFTELHNIRVSGTQCQSFSGPSNEICAGDKVTFTCKVDTLVAEWTVSPSGNNGQCRYLVFNRLGERCGPDDRFQSFATEGADDPFNTSLRVEAVTPDLNQTLVQCIEDDDDVIGSSSICIVGECALLVYKHRVTVC